MGVLKMIIAGIMLIMVVVVMGAPVMSILNGLSPLLNTASTTMKQGTDIDGHVVDVSYANAAGNLTPMLLTAVFFFMIIGFIVWLVMRAPSEPDFYMPPPEQQQGRF